MPPEALKQNNSNSAEAYSVEWIPLIVPALKKGWANHRFKLPPTQPPPKLKDWLALLHITATNPNKVPAYLARLLNTESQTHWAILTDLLALTFEAAQSEADKLTAEDWQTLVAIQNRIYRVVAQPASDTENARQPSAQQFDETLKRLGEVSMLYTMAQQISGSLDLQNMLDTIVTSLRQIVGCRACCIFLLDGSDECLEIKAADGLKPQWREAAKLNLGEGAAGTAAAEARTVYLPDTQKDPNFIVFDEEVRSLMVVPLMAQGKVIGTINVDHNQPDAFGPTQERLLTIAAAQAGVTIENARLFAEISAEQQQTQAIIQHMADGLLLIDGQGVIRRCNYTLVTMLGIKRSEIIGQNVNSPDLHPNLADITTSITHHARTGVLAKDVTIETPRPRALQVFATTVMDDQKKPIGEVRLVHDVTKERELEQLKEDFFSTISHELRTPLFSIQGFAQLMLEEHELDLTTRKEFLETIRRQATQLGEMVNNLLDISKLDEDKLILEKVPLSLLDIINQTILTLQGFAHQQKVKLAPNLPAQLPGIVGDRQRLGQVLTNLIGNAIKFSEAEDAIAITATANEREIIVQVKDNGIGIPAEDLESIFSRYYQAGNRSERSAMGSGLGLHIAKKIVEGHGGRIWAESEDGQGSTFSFSVPVTNST